MNAYFLLSMIGALSFFSLGLKLKNGPEFMESWLAYRTTASLRNEDTWYEGNAYAGKWLMILASLILIILVFAELFATQNLNWLLSILFYSMLISIAIIYILTERHLRKVFFHDGKRRPKF
ncbi:MAG: SdpI family protein [Bacteroidetes bacterium]|jgi:hypothetical protein|nr:SdpI family protein [Bacteroidota bacterium]